MSKFLNYKNHTLFLESAEDNNDYFATIYQNSTQIDYTEHKKTPELAFEAAKKIVDKLGE